MTTSSFHNLPAPVPANWPNGETVLVHSCESHGGISQYAMRKTGPAFSVSSATRSQRGENRLVCGHFERPGLLNSPVTIWDSCPRREKPRLYHRAHSQIRERNHHGQTERKDVSSRNERCGPGHQARHRRKLAPSMAARSCSSTGCPGWKMSRPPLRDFTGAEAIALAADVTDPVAMGQVVAQTLGTFGSIDAVCANAGVARLVPFGNER